jgi:hypothetical protein
MIFGYPSSCSVVVNENHSGNYSLIQFIQNSSNEIQRCGGKFESEGTEILQGVATKAIFDPTCFNNIFLYETNATSKRLVFGDDSRLWLPRPFFIDSNSTVDIVSLPVSRGFVENVRGKSRLC